MLSSKRPAIFSLYLLVCLTFLYSEFDYEIDASGYVKFLWEMMKSEKFSDIRNGFSEPFA